MHVNHFLYHLSQTPLPDFLSKSRKKGSTPVIRTCSLFFSSKKSGYFLFFSVFAGACFKRVDISEALFQISPALEAMVM
jgi:hypothetical protein